MGRATKVNQRAVMRALAAKLLQLDEELLLAQNIANAVVNDPKKHCAATMSSLLVFNNAYPIGVGKGIDNIEQGAVALAKDLERLGWKQTKKSEIEQAPIEAGDVGVVDDGAGTHHIYLILDASDQKKPTIADNQGHPHPRPVEGGPMPGLPKGATVTKFFLRAPDAVQTFELMDIPIV